MTRQGGRGSAHLAADLALIGITALWGATFPLVQRGIDGIPTLHFVFVRFALAGLLLIPAALRVGGTAGLIQPRAFVPGLLLAAGFVFQTEGLRTVGPSVSAFLTSTSVVLVPLACHLLGWDRVTPRRAAAVALALAGVFLLQGMRIPTSWTRGETLTLLCAVAFAGQIVLTGRYAAGLAPAVFTASQVVAAACALALFATLKGELWPGAVWTSAGITAVVFTGVFTTAVAFFVQIWAQARLPATHVAILFSLEPLFAALVSIGFYGDRLDAVGWAGGAAVLAAALLTTTEPSGGAARRSPVT